MKTAWLLFAILTILSSCQTHSLTVQTDYLTHKNLASYYVGTPDPRQNLPAIGQRLIISWAIPKTYLCYDDLHLEITIRFRNKEEQVEIFHLSKTRGTYLYTLLNEDYIAKRGILTYKIKLMGGCYLLEEWRHLIWADLISIGQENPTSQNSLEEECDEEYPIDWEDDDPL